jgi:hypothetical protein
MVILSRAFFWDLVVQRIRNKQLPTRLENMLPGGTFGQVASISSSQTGDACDYVQLLY